MPVAELMRLVREVYPSATCKRGSCAYRVRTGDCKLLGIGVTMPRAWKQALVRILLRG